jgi:hypothetical protein
MRPAIEADSKIIKEKQIYPNEVIAEGYDLTDIKCLKSFKSFKSSLSLFT